jgi:hypothetical protein
LNVTIGAAAQMSVAERQVAIPQFKLGTVRTIVAGVALAIGGLLLIIATHWGHFG